MAESETRTDPSRHSWHLAVVAALLLAPAAWAQPVSREAATTVVDEDDTSEEESAESAAEMEIRLTKQIMLLQRQLNQLTTRLDAIEARTAE